MVVYQYAFQCTTEACTVQCWGTTNPTKCPNDGTHTIDPTSITIVQTVSDNAVTVNLTLNANGTISSMSATAT